MGQRAFEDAPDRHDSQKRRDVPLGDGPERPIDESERSTQHERMQDRAQRDEKPKGNSRWARHGIKSEIRISKSETNSNE
jgi:hypothetical protein